MSRQDTNILTPEQAKEHLEYCERMEYLRGFKRRDEREDLAKAVKVAVETILQTPEIEQKTRKDEYIDARAIFVNIVHDQTNFKEVEIMKFISRDRSNFYNTMSTFKDRIKTSKSFREDYDDVLTFLNLK